MRTSARLLLCLLAGGLLLRLTPLLLAESGTLAGGPDAWYHLRRAQLVAAGQPLTFDAWTGYPFGNTCHWPQGYALLLGTAYRAGGIAAVAAVPLLAGLLALAAALLVFRQRFGGGAWYPLLLLALAPALLFPTVYSAIDHHCLEVLCSVLVLAGLAVPGWRGAVLLVAAVLLAYGSIPSWPLIAALAVAGYAACRLPPRVAVLLVLLAALALLAGTSVYLSDPWLDTVAETRPMLSVAALFRAVVALSPGVLLLPLAVLWWGRDMRDGVAAGLLTLTLLALPLQVIETRFAYFLVLPSAAAAMETLRWLRQRNVRPGPVVLLGVFCLLPSLRGLGELPQWVEDMPAVRAIARQLHTLLPPAGDPLQPQTRPAYGVAARWDWGHHLLAIGGLPVAASPFHTGAAGRVLAHDLMFAVPETANALADAHGIRVLLLDDMVQSGYAGVADSGMRAPLPQSLWARLYVAGDTTLGWCRVAELDGDRSRVQVWTRGW